jgi:lysophospholipase L1-like esterase
MAGNNFTAEASATYNTSTPKFGTGALTGAYTDSSPTGHGRPGGISGPTGLTAVGWSIETWYERAAAPAAQTVLFGTFGSTGTANANSFFVQISAAGLVALNTWDSNATVQTTSNSGDEVTGAYVHIAVTVTAGTAYLFVNGALVGTTTPSSGHTYSCTPTAIAIGNLYGYPDYPDTGGTYDEFVVWPTAKYTAAFTPPSAAYVGNEGMTVLLHLDSNLTDSSIGTPVAIAPNNAAIVYSPYNWTPATSASASTINSGAYFRTLFSGNSVQLNFNVSNNDTPLSEIYYRIDGYEAQTPWTLATVAATITPTMPSNTTQYPFHLLEVVVKSTSQTINRWNSPSNTAVVFTGLEISQGATVLAPMVLPTSYLIYGDSITEGVRTVNQTAANDPDQNDVMQEWSWQLGKALGGEFGIVGFGSQGFTVGGSGNVPAFTTAYASIMAGVSRTFSPPPTAIIINQGSNDGSTPGSVQSDCETVVSALLTASPTSKIVVMEPFGAGSVPPISSLAAVATALQAAVTSIANGNVTYLPTAGFLVQADGIDTTGFHPTGPNASALVAPQVIGAMLPTFQSAGRSYIFGPN